MTLVICTPHWLAMVISLACALACDGDEATFLHPIVTCPQARPAFSLQGVTLTEN